MLSIFVTDAPVAILPSKLTLVTPEALFRFTIELLFVWNVSSTFSIPDKEVGATELMIVAFSVSVPEPPVSASDVFRVWLSLLLSEPSKKSLPAAPVKLVPLFEPVVSDQV